MTRAEALAILASGDFDQFIDAPESLEIEFKGEPYRLEQDSQRFELAKDVSCGVSKLAFRLQNGNFAPRSRVLTPHRVFRSRPVSRIVLRVTPAGAGRLPKEER